MDGKLFLFAAFLFKAEQNRFPESSLHFGPTAPIRAKVWARP
jgi:hypothetical protein